MGMAPGGLLLAGALGCVLVGILSTWFALRQPWMGLRLEPDFERNAVAITRAEGPASELPIPSDLVAIRSESGASSLETIATDLIEEPDFFDTYEDKEEFYRRQTVFAEALRSGAVVVSVRQADGTLSEHRIEPRPRPLSSLPPVYWFQVLAGSIGCLLALWVLVLRPRDWGVRMFAVMGVSFPMFTVPAAIYSTRELALDAATFQFLSSVNHCGAFLYGCGLVALFLSYPRQLVRPRWLSIVFAIFVPWLVLDLLHLPPDVSIGNRIPIMTQMLSAIGLGIWQWHLTRDDARDRASLRWLGVSVLIGSSLFVFMNVGSLLLGWFPPLSQGYSFGFFALMDVGLALGLRRYRLFELDEWAYRILFWVLGALALIALDAVLVLVLHADPTFSLGLALLICGFLYLPLRNWLWTKVVARKAVEDHELFQEVVQVAFAIGDRQRNEKWIALFRKLFDPLEVHEEMGTVEGVRIERDGLELVIPGAGSFSALRVGYPWQGRALFGPREMRLATQLVTLLGHAEKSRDAYDRGVREERFRIARDLHDDIGARLLAGLHEQSLEGAQKAMRFAIGDMRSIVSELTGEKVKLADALADQRHECFERVDAANIELVWPAPDVPDVSLDRRLHRHFVSMLREIVSNAIRHANAKRIDVRFEFLGDRFITTVSDDGIGFDPDATQEGHGLRNLRERTRDIGGRICFTHGANRTSVAVELPFRVESVQIAASA